MSQTQATKNAALENPRHLQLVRQRDKTHNKTFKTSITVKLNI